jgi:SAM-dependent methyltransferase
VDIDPQTLNIDPAQVAQAAADLAQGGTNLKGSISPSRTNAEKLSFADNSFDQVFGTGILHHLDLESVIPEVRRVLHPDGEVVFIEPLGHNILINLFRHCTPRIRSVDEHPLTESDLATLEHYFGQVDVAYFYLLTLFAAPFVNLSCFDWILNFFESIDQYLFKIPFFRRQAWQVLIKLSKPRHV